MVARRRGLGGLTGTDWQLQSGSGVAGEWRAARERGGQTAVCALVPGGRAWWGRPPPRGVARKLSDSVRGDWEREGHRQVMAAHCPLRTELKTCLTDKSRPGLVTGSQGLSCKTGGGRGVRGFAVLAPSRTHDFRGGRPAR